MNHLIAINLGDGVREQVEFKCAISGLYKLNPSLHGRLRAMSLRFARWFGLSGELGQSPLSSAHSFVGSQGSNSQAGLVFCRSCEGQSPPSSTDRSILRSRPLLRQIRPHQQGCDRAERPRWEENGISLAAANRSRSPSHPAIHSFRSRLHSMHRFPIDT